MRKVLYFHHGGAIGGAPMSLLYLLRHVDRTLYNPIVVTTQPGPMVKLYRDEGIETHVADEIAGSIEDFSHTALVWYSHRNGWMLPGKMLRFPASVRNARRIMEYFQPDIVHVNSSTLAAVALGAEKAGVPVIWHIREPLARGYFGFRRAWLRRVIQQAAARVIAISEHDAAQLIPGDHIHVIHNFVDLAEFNRSLSGEAVRAALGLSPEASVVVMLGGVSEPKGTLTLMETVPLVCAAHPETRFLIVGPAPESAGVSGPRGVLRRLLRADAYQRRVLQALEKVSVPEAVTFTGVRGDIPDILAASDLLVFPSTVPHFARPVIEAAAMGKPAIASDLGGPAELIAHGETGLLVPPDDAASLAEAIIELLDDPGRAAEIGEAGYQRAKAMFSAEVNARATLAVYDEIIAEAGK